MSEKTENLTTQEAWAAMAKGECVKCGDGDVRKISDGQSLQRWEPDFDLWGLSSTISISPYSIVPDPSKPKENELGEYEKDRVRVVEASLYLGLEDERSNMICFIEKHFQRKP